MSQVHPFQNSGIVPPLDAELWLVLLLAVHCTRTRPVQWLALHRTFLHGHFRQSGITSFWNMPTVNYATG
jgi:hypothetical protein